MSNDDPEFAAILASMQRHYEAIKSSETFKNSPFYANGRWSEFAVAEGNAVLARAYLASGWSNDFDACPKDRAVMLLYVAHSSRPPKIDVAVYDDYREADYWMPFVPPTPRKEGEK